MAQNRIKQFHPPASAGFLPAVFPLLLAKFWRLSDTEQPALDSTACLRSWNHIVFIPLGAEGNNLLKSQGPILFYDGNEKGFV